MANTVSIGSWSVTYKASWTKAPPDYDGFGTVEIYKDGCERLVLIDTKHFEWQVQRNSSGNYPTWPIEEDISEQWIEGKLIARLNTPFKQEETENA